MKVFCVCGPSGSGKTTTIEKLIGELLGRGHRVASIKDIHSDKFDFDKPGTNTWRHMEAGSAMVVGRGMGKTAVMIPERLEIADLLRWFDHDYVVIEGGREEPFPKILAAKTVEEIEERLDESVFAVSGVISEKGIEISGVPVVNGLGDIGKLADLVELNAEVTK